MRLDFWVNKMLQLCFILRLHVLIMSLSYWKVVVVNSRRTFHDTMSYIRKITKRNKNGEIKVYYADSTF